MELWVRSQNKHTLSNIKSVHINEDNDNNCVDVMGVYSIWNITYLGTYKTKERALEIIDEIQNLIQPIIINKQIKSGGMLADGLSDGVLHTYDVSEIQELSTYVYEMPEE